MDNKEIAGRLKLLAKLMELHDENPFKVKAIQSAVFKIDKFPESLDGLSLKELEDKEGIGKSLAQKIHELNTNNNLPELDYYLSITPEGIIDILKIKGLGPKKVQTIWNDLGIESLIELEYACNENRLIELKGFGEKTQIEVLKSIQFLNSNSGKFLFSKAEKYAKNIDAFLNTLNIKFEFTGEFRRFSQTLECIDIITCTEKFSALIDNFKKEFSIDIIETSDSEIEFKIENLKFKLLNCNSEKYFLTLFKSTGSEEHLSQLDFEKIENKSFQSEQEIYSALSLPFILPELREGISEIEKAKNNSIPTLIELSDIKGTLHNHSTYSDGIHTLSQMANYAKEIGLQYLGISDHSQTAVYAQGLKPEKVLAQHIEIEKLNEKLFPFKIFKGIESDILSDGSLDYEEDILKRFDFIVASIHQGFKMDEEKATNRLIKAIENPYTTILGHPTGRLLLGREGYPINHKKIIEACAQNNVVIELNSNPYRLDIDWRWINFCMDKNVLVSINPDAHKMEGYHDMQFGINVARKGMLTKEFCFNAFNLEEIEKYFLKRKSSIGK